MACRLKSAEISIILQDIKVFVEGIYSKMSFAAECRPFCLSANEIRYQYVYSRQKLGIDIRLSEYIKQRGGVTMMTPRHH